MFYSTNPSRLGRPGGIRARALQSSLSELRAACSCLSRNLPDAFGATDRLLSAFSLQLTGYFDVAESARYFDAIARECPSLERRARVLEHAHAQLKGSFAGASALTGGVGMLEKICTAGLSTQIEDLLDDFERHEHAVADLLQEFVLRAGEAPGVGVGA